MKKLICLFAVALVISCVWAQNSGRTWSATVRVVDESGAPVAGADVCVFYDVPPALHGKDPGRITSLTDSNGVFAASHNDDT